MCVDKMVSGADIWTPSATEYIDRYISIHFKVYIEVQHMNKSLKVEDEGFKLRIK